MPRIERKRLRHHPGVAGLDEAGRGPLAGPVVAAAVVLPKGFNLDGIDDSKRLLPEAREELATRIKEGAMWAVVAVDSIEIDRLNILWASMEAMRRALEALPVAPTKALVDGDRIPPGVSLDCAMQAIVKGDGKMACIAAASIIAKTTRDSLMRELAREYPGYGFDEHFGYSTPEHQEALRRLGPCPIHRRTFWRVREAEQGCLIFDA